MDRYEFARLNATFWCSLSKAFQDYSLQEIIVNWQASYSLHVDAMFYLRWIFYSQFVQGLCF